MAEAARTPTSGRPAPEHAIAHLCNADPVLAQIISAYPGFAPREWLAELPPMGGFQALLFQIAGQQLSVAATRRILARIQACFAGALPTPAEFLAADPERVGGVGLSRRKIATVRAVAQEYVAGTLSDEVLQSLSDQEIEERLTAISGIGPWTAHGYLIIALDRPDVVLPGDLALRKAIRDLYELDHLPSEAEVLEIAEPWRPYRSLATAYVFRAAFGGGAAASG